MNTLSDLSFLLREPDAEYHGKITDFDSSHLLGNFRVCPELYYKAKHGLLPEDKRPAFILGRATHCLTLEGPAAYQRDFAVGGPINPKTGRHYGSNTKAFSEWAEAQRKPVLTDEQHAQIVQLRNSVRNHVLAQKFLACGVPEGVVRADYCGLSCQIRMDWLNPELGIADLKTCDDITWFEADAKRYGYIHQMAFYRAVLAQVIGQLVPVQLIAVEKKQPIRTGLWLISEESLAYAQKENEAALERLKQCKAADTWPTGYEEQRVLDCI